MQFMQLPFQGAILHDTQNTQGVALGYAQLPFQGAAYANSHAQSFHLYGYALWVHIVGDVSHVAHCSAPYCAVRHRTHYLAAPTNAPCAPRG